MRKLKDVIASRQRELKDHVLFELIASTRSTESIAAMARSLAWWPMVFQDLLRLNVELLRGTELEKFAEHHQHEDAGHDRWYLDDLRALGVTMPDLDELFGPSYQPIREACYSLMGEVLREGQAGAQRVGLLLTLESTGHVFFEQISAAVDRVCPHLPLRYFSHTHLSVEKDHDLFTESTNADLDRIVFGDADRAESEEAVARVYRTFDRVFTYLEAPLRECMRGPSDIRALGAETIDLSVRRASGG